MTRNRVPYRGLGMIAAAVASVLSPNVFSQGGRATLINMPGNPWCDYSSIAMLSNGKVDVTCTPVVAGAPGQVGFTAASFPLAKADTVASVPFNVTVQRIGGITGLASATLNVTGGPCGPVSQPVAFADGIGGAATVPLTATGVYGTCNLSLTAVTGATEGLLTSSVVIAAPPPSGGTIIPGCEGKTPTTNFTQHPLTFPNGPGSATYFTETGIGKIHSWPMPKGTNGLQIASGLVGHTASGLPGFYTPDTLRVEWSLSKCPGDVTYASAPEASYTSRGTVYHPCAVDSASESGGVKWNGAGGLGYCKVPQTEAWFVNLRYTNGCVGACSIVYFWQGG